MKSFRTPLRNFPDGCERNQPRKPQFLKGDKEGSSCQVRELPLPASIQFDPISSTGSKSPAPIPNTGSKSPPPISNTGSKSSPPISNTKSSAGQNPSFVSDSDSSYQNPQPVNDSKSPSGQNPSPVSEVKSPRDQNQGQGSENKSPTGQNSNVGSESESPGRLSADLLELKISKIVDEILLNHGKSEKFSVKKKKDVDKALKKLSFHEKFNKNLQLFNEHLKEETINNATMYSCKTCPSFPSTINKVIAERHAKAHGFAKKRPRDHTFAYECVFCDEKFTKKKFSNIIKRSIVPKVLEKLPVLNA